MLSPFNKPQVTPLKPSSPSPPHRPKTMEEVWNDITLASLHDHHSSSSSREPFSSNPHLILQDFLAARSDPPPPQQQANGGGDNNTMLYGSPLPPPATVLSLNSGPGFDFLDNPRLQSSPISTLPTFNSPFEALASSTTFGKKRTQDSENSSGDRRHKRMIKNRESAARSRARKQVLSFHYITLHLFPLFFCLKIHFFLQAYTNELELEVAHLMEENAKLRRQQEQVTFKDMFRPCICLVFSPLRTKTCFLGVSFFIFHVHAVTSSSYCSTFQKTNASTNINSSILSFKKKKRKHIQGPISLLCFFLTKIPSFSVARGRGCMWFELEKE